jgi:hypothetical protein
MPAVQPGSPAPESGWHLNVSLESQHGYGSDGDAPVDGELLQQRATQEGHRKEDIDTGEIRSMYFKQPHDAQRCAEPDDRNGRTLEIEAIDGYQGQRGAPVTQIRGRGARAMSTTGLKGAQLGKALPRLRVR